jgi:hypothetical protein
MGNGREKKEAVASGQGCSFTMVHLPTRMQRHSALQLTSLHLLKHLGKYVNRFDPDTCLDDSSGRHLQRLDSLLSRSKRRSDYVQLLCDHDAGEGVRNGNEVILRDPHTYHRS